MSNQTRFNELCDAVLDERATDEQIRELESLVLGSPEFLRQYAQAAALHGDLSLLGSENEGSHTEALLPPEQKAVDDALPAPPKAWQAGLIAIAASLVIAFAVNSLLGRGDTVEKNTFAVLETTFGCLWQQSSIPTNQGQRLGAGHLQLAEGIASLRFDNGAIVDIEGPAHLEIQDSMHCTLHRGTLVVALDGDLDGFVVDTPNGRLVDQGTSFGVSVKEDGRSVVEVFDGLVDVEHGATGQKRRLKEEESAWLLADGITSEDDDTLAPEKGELVQFVTGVGQGSDVWLQRDPSIRKGPDDLLLAKRSLSLMEYDRQIHLRFDLSEFDAGGIKRAQLQLTAVPSGIGFASRTQDCQFSVLGRFRSEGDRAKWLLNAEAAEMLKVGEFTIPKGIQSGAFSIDSSELVAMLKKSEGKLLELVVLRETQESQQGGLVHAFASSRHESLPGPILRVWK